MTAPLKAPSTLSLSEALTADTAWLIHRQNTSTTRLQLAEMPRMYILRSMDSTAAPASPPSNGITNKSWFHRLFKLGVTAAVDDSTSSALEAGELQNMITKNSDTDSSKRVGEVCLLTDSPFRILRAAESGNVEEFKRLYTAVPARIAIRDSRGRTAAHLAAHYAQLAIMKVVHAVGGDMDAQDNVGNTPLHIAVEKDAIEIISFLLEIPVNSTILNEKKQAAVHLATELNRAGTLHAMSAYRQVIDIQQGGEHGRSALHLAAIYDHEECARILITEFGACPRRPCNNGYYPIHEAAKNASSKTMEVFLQWGESQGCSREEMMSFYDSEGNVPLHSAVHGGDIKAVELCLKSGAKISTQQHDLSTPVHLACSQGATDIIKLMFGLQPSEKHACLKSCDVQRMTPLHCAAMFDHPEIVEYLVGEGSDINMLDKEMRSPLLLAASRAGWRTVHTLIRLKANVNLKDMGSRNVLHLVVINGGRLEDFSDLNKINNLTKKENLFHLLNEKDSMGCSPLHYASREGHIRSLESLIQLGACINLKNNNNESPLHFAARYGRYNTVCQLLDSEKGAFIINESDGGGLTPLHIASQQGHTRVVQLLLNRGALLHRDHNGRNPLHLAAMSGYTQTVEMLHSVHSHLLNQTDKDGNTALHLATMENKPKAITLLLSMDCHLTYNSMDMSAIDYAIYYKFPDSALAMVTHERRAREIMCLRSDKHPCVTLALIAFMPRVFESVQDKCITKANCKKDSKSFYIKYEFHHYQRTQAEYALLKKIIEDPSLRPQPLCVVNAMVSHGRVELLAHPLSQKYLEMKWNSYGKYFHLVRLLFYCIFLTLVTMFSSDLMTLGSNKIYMKDIVKSNLSQTFGNDTEENISNSVLKRTTLMYFSASGILIYNVLCSIREAFNVYQHKLHYVMDPSNFVSWMLCICSSLMIAPIGVGCLSESQYSFAAITVFLSWFQLLLLLQYFDQVGIYVVMFLEILQTLIKVLTIFSILIIAFGLAFFILLSQGQHLSFSSVPMSLMRTFTMMLGEIDFVGTYVQPYFKAADEKQLLYPFPTFYILLTFMVLMPILLMNLLIGLAVGDIESVRRNAQLKRLAMQVLLHTELERKLPQMLLQKVDRNELIEYPNHTKCKLGFLDFILRKWLCNPFTEEDMSLESNESYITNELEKQKARLKKITTTLDQQHQLLRLIVQKMEIKTEADDVDEGASPKEIGSMLVPRSNWKSPRLRKNQRTQKN